MDLFVLAAEGDHGTDGPERLLRHTARAGVRLQLFLCQTTNDLKTMRKQKALKVFSQINKGMPIL